MTRGRAAAAADAAAVPQQGQLDLLAVAPDALDGRARRGARRVRAARDDALRLLVEKGAVRGVRTAPMGLDRAGKAAARRRAADGDRRAGDGAGRGHAGPPARRRARPLRDRVALPAGLRDRRQGGLEGRAAARPDHPHARLAAARRGQVRRGRRLVHLPDGPRAHLRRLRASASSTPTAALSPHDMLQEFKTHKFMRRLLEGGERVAWGAKTIPSGGYYSIPDTLALPGAVLTGDSAGLVEHAAPEGRPLRDALGHARGRGDLRARCSAAPTSAEPGALGALRHGGREGRIGKDLHRVPQHAPGALARPRRRAAPIAGADGRSRAASSRAARGASTPTPSTRWSRAAARPIEPDGALTFDKLSSVFLRGNRTRDDQPNHIRDPAARPARARGARG